jgi:hypothetical protein
MWSNTQKMWGKAGLVRSILAPVTFFLDEKSNQKNQGFIEILRLRGTPLPKIWLFKKTRFAQTLFKKPNFACGTAPGLAPSEFL